MMDNILNFFTKSIKSSFKTYENKFKSYFSKIKNVSKQISRIIKNVIKSTMSYIFGKPSSLKDYIKTGEVYVSKRFLLKTVIFLTFIFLFVFKFAIPYLDGRLWTAAVVVNTSKYHNFTGKAKVLNSSGDMVYLGGMEEGVVSGFGEVYRDDEIIYKGNMSNNKYNGQGTLYENGFILYEGNFDNNGYSGEGKLYYSNGKLKFTGIFLDGNYQSGTEYYTNGYMKYSGTYDEYGYNGMGKLYSSQLQASVIYSGEFQKNQYNGQGQLFQNNRLIYEGGFQNGKYNGEGVLYSYENGKQIYSGGFKNNFYMGYGKLNDKETGRVIYDGYFDRGFYDGTGKLFNGTGRVVYEGDFANGLYNGMGKVYGDSGNVIFQGDFFEGNINYMTFFNSDIDNVRNAFGKEEEIYMLENSFAICYNGMKLAFEFDYVDSNEKPILNKIKFFGNQEINNVKNGMTVYDSQKIYQGKVFTEYNFQVSDEDAFFFAFSNSKIYEGDSAYSIKYIIGDYYIRLYSPSSKGTVCYYEMGGI